METIDSEHRPSKPRELWTIKLLLISVMLTALTIISVAFDGVLHIPHRYLMFLPPFSIIIVLVSSLAGFIVGFYERKKNKRQALFGIIGNLIVLIFYLLTILLVINTIEGFGPN